jgi:hypothetical protein
MSPPEIPAAAAPLEVDPLALGAEVREAGHPPELEEE